MKHTIPVAVKALRMLDHQFTDLDYGTPGAAALDLRACIDQPILLERGGMSVLIPTGIAIHIKDPNYAGFILPRSGMGHKQGLVLGNGTGLLDSDYQGEVFISAWARPQGDLPASRPSNTRFDTKIIATVTHQISVRHLFESKFG